MGDKTRTLEAQLFLDIDYLQCDELFPRYDWDIEFIFKGEFENEGNILSEDQFRFLFERYKEENEYVYMQQLLKKQAIPTGNLHWAHKWVIESFLTLDVPLESESD